MPGNITTKINMCAYGMQIPDGNGNTFVYKPTQFATNSPCIAARLNRKCDKSHNHAQLLNGRAAAAAVYPKQLVDEITSGIQEQLRCDTHDALVIGRIELTNGLYNLEILKEAITFTQKSA